MNDPGRDPLTDPFAATLPETTTDERDVGWGEDGDREHDDWLRGEVPPHHG